MVAPGLRAGAVGRAMALLLIAQGALGFSGVPQAKRPGPGSGVFTPHLSRPGMRVLPAPPRFFDLPRAAEHPHSRTRLRVGLRDTHMAAKAAAPKIIIAGAPASGKGTQCELLKEALGVVHLSTGDMLRAAVKDGTPLGKEAKAYMDSGKLVPDDVIIGMVKARLSEPDCQTNGWLLDGFPRTKAQAEALTTLGISPDAFILLNVPDEVLVERVVGRRTDSQTGKIYHLRFSPPPPDVPPERLVHRSDDTEDKVKVRLTAFHEHCDAVSGCYKDVMVQVDGTQSKDAVFGAITKGVDKQLQKAKDDDDKKAGPPGSGGLKTAAKTTLSLAALVATDQALGRLFLVKGVAFPSSLAGMLALFAALVGLQGGRTQPSALYRAVKPGAAFLTRWLAVFFAPSLVLLPLSSSQLSPRVAPRLLALVAIGFEGSLFLTQRLASLLPSASTSVEVPKVAAPAPFTERLHKTLAAGTLVSAISAIALRNTDPLASSLLRAAFGAFATLTGFVTGARMPSKFRATVHPLLTCAGLALAMLGAYGAAAGETLTQQLQSYVTRSACPVHLGGGDLLLGLLGPSILAMAVQVFEYRKLLFANALRVLATCLGSSVFGLLSSAATSRMLKLPKALGLSTLSRCITTPLALSVAKLVGADAPIAVLLVVVTGLLGASQGAARLSGWGVKDPVTRGLAMGASAHGIGTASLSDEPQAFAFSAISMALTGVLTCTLITLPPVRSLITALATAGP